MSKKRDFKDSLRIQWESFKEKSEFNQKKEKLNKFNYYFRLQNTGIINSNKIRKWLILRTKNL